jgi:hypothetical protein
MIVQQCIGHMFYGMTSGFFWHIVASSALILQPMRTTALFWGTLSGFLTINNFNEYLRRVCLVCWLDLIASLGGRISFVRHLSRIVGAVLICHGFGKGHFPGYARSFQGRAIRGRDRGTRQDDVNMQQVLVSFVCFCPLHVIVWWLGRCAVREARVACNAGNPRKTRP